MAKKQVEKVEETGKSVFLVFDSKGDFVREYTVEDSGKEAGELARVFAEELNGSVQ